MASGHTLLTIPSNACSLALYKAGVQSKLNLVVLINPNTDNFIRCTAPSRDLDNERHMRRSAAHTDFLAERLEIADLWDNYGIVGDIKVIFLFPHQLFNFNFTFRLCPSFFYAALGLFTNLSF